MKLYFSKGACSLAVRIIIHEVGAKAEFEAVDIKIKKTETGEDFFKINPKGAVPVLLTDDKEILTENAAIQQYLADKYQAEKLLPPSTNFKRYRVLEWLNFAASDLHKGFGPLFNPNFPQDVKDSFVKPLLKSKFSYVNQHLQKNKYLTGEEFTLPDAYLFLLLTWLAHFDMDLKEWPELARFFNEVKNRPAVKKSLEEEGLNL
jgi:glutathione S-transferase